MLITFTGWHHKTVPYLPVYNTHFFFYKNNHQNRGVYYTVPFEDKRTTQRVPHAEPTRWRFELNALAFACPRKRKRV